MKNKKKEVRWSVVVYERDVHLFEEFNKLVGARPKQVVIKSMMKLFVKDPKWRQKTLREADLPFTNGNL